ncbi:MAG: hypothetical protein ACRDI2_24205, partial [Chloroflexota bacterium]
VFLWSVELALAFGPVWLLRGSLVNFRRASQPPAPLGKGRLLRPILGHGDGVGCVMDQEELKRMVRRHEAAIKELEKAVRPTPKVVRELGQWATSTHVAVSSLFSTVDTLLDTSAEILKTPEKLAVSHDITKSELAELQKLQEQFQAVQENFGAKIARARETSPPSLSVITGGTDDET